MGKMTDRQAMFKYLGMSAVDPTAAGRFWFERQRDVAQKKLRKWFLGRRDLDYWEDQLKVANDYLYIADSCDALLKDCSA